MLLPINSSQIPVACACSLLNNQGLINRKFIIFLYRAIISRIIPLISVWSVTNPKWDLSLGLTVLLVFTFIPYQPWYFYSRCSWIKFVVLFTRFRATPLTFNLKVFMATRALVNNSINWKRTQEQTQQKRSYLPLFLILWQLFINDCHFFCCFDQILQP